MFKYYPIICDQCQKEVDQYYQRECPVTSNLTIKVGCHGETESVILSNLSQMFSNRINPTKAFVKDTG
jgi:hypothetical protein